MNAIAPVSRVLRRYGACALAKPHRPFDRNLERSDGWPCSCASIPITASLLYYSQESGTQLSSDSSQQ